MIIMKNVCKTFRVSRRNAGFAAAARSLFHKEYKEIKALDHVSFAVKDGEMVGYIGPNGAGKSSTIKIMSGILTPEEGECSINGRTPWKERIAHVKEIGVVFGQRSQLWWDVPVVDSFELIRDIYAIPEKKYRENLNELVTLLHIEDIIKTPARQLSLGQRMRCEITASLLHDPKTLFLDEPTIGLDAVSKIAVRSFIKDINAQRKTTVILTTHDMQDIESLAKRILLIGKGKILLDGDLETLKKQYTHQKKVIVDYKGGAYSPRDGISLLESNTGRSVFAIDTSLLSVSEAISHLSSTLDIEDLSISGATADDMVVSMYRQYHI